MPLTVLTTLTDAKPRAVELVRTAEARTDDKPRAVEFTRTAEVRRRETRIARLRRKSPRSGVKDFNAPIALKPPIVLIPPDDYRGIVDLQVFDFLILP